MRFKFCPECGEKLIMKSIGDEGDVPFCKNCDRPWFDMFSNAVIVLVVNEYGEAALLRQDYLSTECCVLVSGYIKPGETAEQTALREVSEEIGIELTDNKLVGTYWFKENGVLMTGFIAHTKDTEFRLSDEVDSAEWIPAEEAINMVHGKGSVSYELLSAYLKRGVSECFVQEMQTVKWFRNGGIPCEKYFLIHSVYEAYDDLNDNYLSVWEPQTHFLEKIAQELIGDDVIEDIFDTVSLAFDNDIWREWIAFRERSGLEEQNALDEEITDMVKRDLCWAAVERAVNVSGFFNELLEIYRDGYFPCGWEGEYPDGRPIVM